MVNADGFYVEIVYVLGSRQWTSFLDIPTQSDYVAMRGSVWPWRRFGSHE